MNGGHQLLLSCSDVQSDEYIWSLVTHFEMKVTEKDIHENNNTTKKKM